MTDAPLVSTVWLNQHLDDPAVRVVDASWYMPGQPGDARGEYAERHIPGAVFFDIDEIADHTSALPHMLPEPGEFAVQARRLGVGPNSHVVVYDSKGLFSAPRVWWSFRAMGHARVSVLDGGLPQWIAEARPLEAGWPVREHGEFKAHYNPALVRDFKAVSAALDAGDQVLDARSAPRFRGDEPEPRDGLRAGHMPGARNLPWGHLIGADGRLVDVEALTAAFKGAGIDLDRPVITTCGSGVSAAILALGLARLGREAAVYDGSWAEWGARAGAPVATGPA